MNDNLFQIFSKICFALRAKPVPVTSLRCTTSAETSSTFQRNFPKTHQLLDTVSNASPPTKVTATLRPVPTPYDIASHTRSCYWFRFEWWGHLDRIESHEQKVSLHGYTRVTDQVESWVCLLFVWNLHNLLLASDWVTLSLYKSGLMLRAEWNASHNKWSMCPSNLER